jgi:putative addiction module component (TIGR02574 family)
MVYPAIEIASLTVGERLELIERVWDSLRRDAGGLPLGDAERAIIEARRTEHRENPDAAVAWETVRADLVSDQEADETQARSAKRG